MEAVKAIKAKTNNSRRRKEYATASGTLLTRKEQRDHRKRIQQENQQEKNLWTTPNHIIERDLNKGINQIILETHEQGLSTCHADKDGIYLLHPNGTKEYIS